MKFRECAKEGLFVAAGSKCIHCESVVGSRIVSGMMTAVREAAIALTGLLDVYRLARRFLAAVGVRVAD